MNLDDIIKAVNEDVDDLVDAGTITRWVNRALDIASNVAKYKKRLTLVFEAGVPDYELPSDLLDLLHVFGSEGKYNELELDNYDDTGYKLWGDTIGFQNTNDTSVDLYYHAYYPHVSTLTDVPKLPVIFHDLLVLYAIGRVKYQEEEEERFISGAIGEFAGRLEAFRLFMEKKNKQNKVRITTDW